MSVAILKPYPRLWTLNSGIVMVVTDLHGDWDAYQRYRDRFVDLQAKDKADCLIFTGDLIHQQTPDLPDHSLEIILDVLELQAVYGAAIICLCGNHELPHIYSIGLGKGEIEYTPQFEAVLSQSAHRAAVIDFFETLPFFVRTAAGVSITHAGASTATEKQQLLKILEWSHRKQLTETEAFLKDQDIALLRTGYAKLSQVESYEELARHYIGVTGPNDPRYDDLLRGAFATGGDYHLVHEALFTKCEQKYGNREYAEYLDSLLEHLSEDYKKQKVMIAGHMTIVGGYEIIGEKHLRLASGYHATPLEAGLYLRFDTGEPVEGIEDLLAGLESVY